MPGQPTSSSCTCDRRPRAVGPCSVHVHPLPEKRAEQTERTGESVKAETAYRDWSLVPPSERPLVKHRAAHARVLFELLRDHAVSRSWFALQIGLNEKQVRKMLKAEISIPSQVSSCMPLEMRTDYLERLAVIDGASRPTLQDRIDSLDLAGAIDAQRRITDRISKLAQGAK